MLGKKHFEIPLDICTEYNY